MPRTTWSRRTCQVATISAYLGKVFHAHALDLLRSMPVESVDAVITDAMYGTAKRCL